MGQRLIVFKNDGHWPDNLKSMPVHYNAHLEWFQTYLGGGPPLGAPRTWCGTSSSTSK
ncbi:MAG: hypothetical protein IPP58_01935 [Holophagaceae bacterium]|uniref:Uncharacterized protein n=1 Tax=Candidatus Geothrix skivensis TaxID=2954439 RepID=A0A9D7XGR1_9BACT|nr:hypothetical protein [Candidatus Geothrix skivensis]